MSKPIDWETEIIYRGRPLSDFANAIREECAKVADEAEWQVYGYRGRISSAIRALKDKQ